jgi:hypothetical protein
MVFSGVQASKIMLGLKGVPIPIMGIPKTWKGAKMSQPNPKHKLRYKK